MFFELPEILRCPRCGPEHPLVLLVAESQDRRVRRGWLGCPNCGRDFPVSGGVGDLRLDRERADPSAGPYSAPELAVKIGALSGVAEAGGGYLLLDGPLAPVAREVAGLLPEVEVVALARSLDELGRGVGDGEGEEGGAGDGGGEGLNVSRLYIDTPAPIGIGVVAAAATVLGPADRMVALAQAVRSDGRLVLFGIGEDDLGFLDGWGYELIAREGDTAVARRRSGGAIGSRAR